MIWGVKLYVDEKLLWTEGDKLTAAPPVRKAPVDSMRNVKDKWSQISMPSAKIFTLRALSRVSRGSWTGVVVFPQYAWFSLKYVMP